MKFTPKSEQEVSRIFEKGNYKFRVDSAEEKKSKNGNPMLHLKLQLIHNTIPGKKTIVDCYLLTDNSNFEFLLRHFCYAVGLGIFYEKGDISADMCIDTEQSKKRGIVKIGIESDKEGKYPDKNKVIDFVLQKENESKEDKSLPIDDDDVPF